MQKCNFLLVFSLGYALLGWLKVIKMAFGLVLLFLTKKRDKGFLELF